MQSFLFSTDEIKYSFFKTSTSYFRYFEHIWLLRSRTKMPTCRNWNVYLHAKNELHPLFHFRDIVKILSNLRSLIKPINNDGITIKETSLMIKSLKSTFRKLWCFICMEKIDFISLTSFMRCCKTFQTFYFGNFGNACPSQQK